MAFYYVKNTGSSTTAGGTTKQTGAFSGLAAAAVYGSIADAITYGAGSGDIVCVSDDHSSTALEVWTGPTSGDALYITTVDDANCDTETEAATTQTTQADVTIQNQITIKGGYNTSDDDVSLNGQRSINLINNTLEVTGSGDKLLYISGDGTSVTMVNPTLIGVAGSWCITQAGATLNIYGGTLTGQTDSFTTGGFGNGGAIINIDGLNMSSITGTMFKDVGNDVSIDDTIDITVHGAKLNASFSGWFNEELASYNQRLKVTNSAATSTAAEYQYYEEGYGGFAEDQDDAGIHRDESTAFPSTTKVSIKCDTSTPVTNIVSRFMPFWFDLPTRYAELSTVTDSIRVYLVCEDTLYDTDVHIDLLCPDDTDNNEWNYNTTRHDNLLDTNGTALTTDSGSTWKDGVGDIAGTWNEYYIDIDTSLVGNGGEDSVPVIRVYVSKETIIYFDTSIGVV